MTATAAPRPIRTLLVANRGEIAVRVMRTARAMGIRTVAVHSEADREALHVRSADVAVEIGPAPARSSYLDIAAVLEAARRTGADAVHPGYGFLSENADFAEAVEAAGMIFVGPPAAAIRAMGSKSAAKALMGAAGVPLVPGYHGEDQDPSLLAGEAARIGWPVLIKASAGGGGKGMKVVRSAGEFAAQLASARREAAASFGDDRVLIERYLTRPRHIEVQVFADRHGNAVHLFERDCSIQRRHQKVVEEAPAPGLDADRRAAMGAAAVAAARAVGYVGAGTVEFIAEGDAFYFMEMNTRLQVEHPVTEAITGQDLVAWQIRVARGEPLPLTQEALSIAGHAIEVRLYAEDPARDFLPQTGRLDHLALPTGIDGVRVDAGVAPGDAVSHHYDPMIAKIIASGADRDEALGRMRTALAATSVAGVVTNRRFLAAIAGHPAFAAAELDTGFIDRHAADLLPPPAAVPARVLALAALACLAADEREARAAAPAADPWSPFAALTGFQPNLPGRADVTLADGERLVTVELTIVDGRVSAAGVGGETIRISGDLAEDGRLRATVDGVTSTALAVRTGDRILVQDGDGEYRLRRVDPRLAAAREGAAEGRLSAPMPGTVTAVAVAAGDRVARGAPLVVVEAMKMEHVILAPMDGVVVRLPYGVGDQVEEGAELAVVEALAETAETGAGAPAAEASA